MKLEEAGAAVAVLDRTTASSFNPFTNSEPWRLPAAASPSKGHHRDVQTTGTPWTPETLAVELQARGLKVELKRNGYWSQCPCPEHDDADPSLHFHAGYSVPLVVKCRSRCPQADVLKAIGPPPGWTAQPYVLQLPDNHSECMCVMHEVDLDNALEAEGEVLTPALEADLLRFLHREQRQRMTQVQIASPRTRTTCLVLLGAVSAIEAAPRRVLGLQDVDLQTWPHEALATTPKRMGKVMKLVLDDLVEQANARLAVGDQRAVPYASRTVADRLGDQLGADLGPEDAAAKVRDALRRLRKARVVMKVGELPVAGQRDGMPLYALAVRARCPFCPSDVEARASVPGLDTKDATATGDRHGVLEPRDEQTQLTAVAVAELEDVADRWLAAFAGGAGGLDGPVGHAGERYAPSRVPPGVLPFGDPPLVRTHPTSAERKAAMRAQRNRETEDRRPTATAGCPA